MPQRAYFSRLDAQRFRGSRAIREAASVAFSPGRTWGVEGRSLNQRWGPHPEKAQPGMSVGLTIRTSAWQKHAYMRQVRLWK